MERRSQTWRNWLRRHTWPPALLFGQRIAPLSVALVAVVYSLWATPPDLFGFVPISPTVEACAAAMFAGAVWYRFRPATLAAVTVAELGLSMTLLFQGSPLEIPRQSEWLGAALHGSVWLLYLSVHIVTEVHIVARARLV